MAKLYKKRVFFGATLSFAGRSFSTPVNIFYLDETLQLFSIIGFLHDHLEFMLYPKIAYAA